jgi:hypothetical protein
MRVLIEVRPAFFTRGVADAPDQSLMRRRVDHLIVTEAAIR